MSSAAAYKAQTLLIDPYKAEVVIYEKSLKKFNFYLALYRHAIPQIANPGGYFSNPDEYKHPEKREDIGLSLIFFMGAGVLLEFFNRCLEDVNSLEITAVGVNILPATYAIFDEISKHFMAVYDEDCSLLGFVITTPLLKGKFKVNIHPVSEGLIQDILRTWRERFYESCEECKKGEH